MQPVVTPPNKTPSPYLLERRCPQCGENLATQSHRGAPPAARTRVELCNDCSVHDLPHTD